MLKIGINGYGRIGRTILRALYEQDRRREVQIVAINDLGDAQINAHLTCHDTVHGRFGAAVKVDDDALIINDDRVQVFSERDPARLPWSRVGADIVLECTGLFTSKAKASKHLEAGAKKVLISAHDPHSSIYDATMTKVIGGTLVKVCAWYDNEWGFSSRMLDTALAWSRAA